LSPASAHSKLPDPFPKSFDHAAVYHDTSLATILLDCTLLEYYSFRVSSEVGGVVEGSSQSPYKWTLDALKSAAEQCSTRGEFKARFPGGYNQAIKYKALDSICAHMTSRYQTWDDEALQAEARKYSTRAEFRAGSPNAYAAAVRQRRLFILEGLFHPETKGFGHHLVYRLTFKSCVYFGLTCTSELRKKYHLVRGPVAEYLRETGEDLPVMEIIVDGLSPEEAGRREIHEIAVARNLGLSVLNKASGGQLGAFGRSLWTKERVLAEAKRYATRTDFKLGASTAFSHAREEGWLTEACAHMQVLRKTYSDQELERVARRFSSRGALQRYEPSVYNAARARGILDAVCGHMALESDQPTEAPESPPS
jgi:hypothetical protein